MWKCFKDKKKLQEHTRMQVKFECDECDKMFRWEAFLEKHNEENCRMLSCSTTTVIMASVYIHKINTKYIHSRRSEKYKYTLSCER